MALNVQQTTDSDGSLVNLPINPANHQIMSRGNVIGVVQSFSPNESVTVTPIMSLGIEGVVTLAKSNYQGGTFSTPLVAIYDTEPLEAFGIVDNGGGIGGLRPLTRIKSLYQQREPLDIRAITNTPSTGEEYVETYRTCWITSYSKTITATSSTIGINVGWRYAKVI